MGKNLVHDEISRRGAMKTALKAGGYTAPVILSATVPMAVSAAGPVGADLVLG